jgi:hypothetical protein
MNGKKLLQDFGVVCFDGLYVPILRQARLDAIVGLWATPWFIGKRFD